MIQNAGFVQLDIAPHLPAQLWEAGCFAKDYPAAQADAVFDSQEK